MNQKLFNVIIVIQLALIFGLLTLLFVMVHQGLSNIEEELDHLEEGIQDIDFDVHMTYNAITERLSDPHVFHIEDD